MSQDPTGNYEMHYPDWFDDEPEDQDSQDWKDWRMAYNQWIYDHRDWVFGTATASDGKNSEDQTCDNEGLESDAARVFHVHMHADTMEISHANEVGTNPRHEVRRAHYNRIWSHMKTFKYEYAAGSLLTAYKLFNKFFGALDDMEAAHERRVIRHGQLRFYAPHHPAAQAPTPHSTPQKKRVIRAIAKTLDPHLGFPVRRYRRN